MAQRTPVLHVEPLPQADAVEEVLATCYFRGPHLLVTNRTHIVQSLQLFLLRLRQALDFIDGSPPLHENHPAGPGLAPDVEVGVDAHHDGSDGTAALENQDPHAVEEQEDAEAELDGVAEGSDVINVIVELLPKGLLACVEQEEGIDRKGHSYFYDDFDAESADGQKPGRDFVVVPEIIEQGYGK